MSTLTVTVAGTDIDYGEVELTRGTSDALPAPEAEVTGAVGDFTAGDSVTIATDTETLFTGQVARPRIRQGGRRDLTCEHDLAPLFEESVDVPPTTSVTTALESAVTNASTSATVQFTGTDVTLGEQYVADGRSVRRIFADLTERTGRVWRIDDPDTIVVEPLGANGTVSVDVSTADAAVRQFDPGDARTVINDVTVNGTGGERVVGTASDATSISTYGTRSQSTNVNYIETQSEADAYADALLRPDPLASAAVIVGARSLDVVSQQANATLTLTDPSRGIDGVELVVEEQTNTSGGSAVLKVGEGAASSLVTENRQNRSRDDLTKPGSVYGNDRIGDNAVDSPQLVDTSVIEQKLADAGVTSSKLVDGAVIEQKIADAGVTSQKLFDSAVLESKLADLSVSETKIQDGSISTPKLTADAVTANEIAAFSITADEIAGRTITGLKLAAETITGEEIDAQTITGNKIVAGEIDTLQLAAEAVTANEILAGTITADEITARTITALEIESGTLTANEIDTLDLDTNELSIGAGLDGIIEFQDLSSGADTVAVMLPNRDDDCFVGLPGTRFAEAHFREVNASNFVTQTPEPFVETVDLSKLSGFSWRNPPEYVAQRKAGDGSFKRTNPNNGVEIGHYTNYLLEVCKKQQQKIEDIEARLATLEADADPNA